MTTIPEQLVTGVRDRVSDTANSVREQLADAAMTAQDQMQQARSTAVGYIQRNPLWAVAIAVTVGVVCGIVSTYRQSD